MSDLRGPMLNFDWLPFGPSKAPQKRTMPPKRGNASVPRWENGKGFHNSSAEYS